MHNKNNRHIIGLLVLCFDYYIIIQILDLWIRWSKSVAWVWWMNDGALEMSMS